MATGLLVRVLFGALVVATTGALLVTQRLKRAPAPVERVHYPRYFSPNGDGRADTALMRFRLRESTEVTVDVLRGGVAVRRLATDLRLERGGPYRFRWDGRTDGGRIAADGAYQLRVRLPRQGRSLTAARVITIDTRPPRVRLRSVEPAILPRGLPPPRRVIRLRFRASRRAAPLVTVHRRAGGGWPEVDRFRVPPARTVALWRATVRGRRAPVGTYLFSLTAEDRAGNRATAPSPLPRSRAQALREGVGVTIRAPRRRRR